jgi:hypothetical protein
MLGDDASPEGEGGESEGEDKGDAFLDNSPLDKFDDCLIGGVGVGDPILING